MAGHVVGDQRGRDAVLLQFPDRQPRALQKRARLIGKNIDLFAAFDGRANDAQSGAIPGRSQRARIAVREHCLAVGHQRRAVPADGLADGDIFLANQLGFFDQALADLLDRRWPRADA